MIIVGEAYVSDDIKDKMFVCDLEKCKGACCIEGDMGAPVAFEEIAIMEKILPKVKPYLSKAGLAAIDKKGIVESDGDGGWATTTIGSNKECVFAIYDERKTLKCGIEQAYLDGKVKFQKPISCHLYPIRITKYDQYDAVNYERWDICKPACSNGKKLGVPLYKFLKGPLIRKYGEPWYNELVKLIDEEVN